MGVPPLAQSITAAGGAPDFADYAKETILTMRGPGFLEKLPYLTSPGYLGGGDEAEVFPRSVFTRTVGRQLMIEHFQNKRKEAGNPRQ